MIFSSYRSDNIIITDCPKNPIDVLPKVIVYTISQIHLINWQYSTFWYKNKLNQNFVFKKHFYYSVYTKKSPLFQFFIFVTLHNKTFRYLNKNWGIPKSIPKVNLTKILFAHINPIFYKHFMVLFPHNITEKRCCAKWRIFFCMVGMILILFLRIMRT